MSVRRVPVLADVEREERGQERDLIRDELELALRDVELPDRKIEAELVQPRVVLLSLKVDDLPWETGGRSGSGQFALLGPASVRSSSGPATSSLSQPRPIGRGRRDRACSPQAGDHRVAVLAGRVAGHAAGAILARAAPHELRR